MRLLNVNTLQFTEFRDSDRPAYITASHRWLSDGEATYQDVRDGHNTKSRGYQKVEAFAKYIQQNLPTVKWLWIDTCCINKDSAAELSEAINSMFEWYRGADLCLVYLADVPTVDGTDCFEKSEWFKRGWTLQELLAPRRVVFVTSEWQIIGYKGDCRDRYDASVEIGLERTIARITGIPEQVLRGYEASYSLSTYGKLRWMDGRQTTRPEDMSYALFGLLGVTLPVIYGEKYEGARQRLLDVIYQRDNAATQQAKYLREIACWLSSTDPWTDHEIIRQRHEPQTGVWLLQHSQYLAWKSGLLRSLWLYGKAGSGKTVLCSTAIEDIRTHCQHAPNAGHAIFYFSFSDNSKQTYEDLVRSLVAQLSWKEPGRTLLKQAYENIQKKQLQPDELQKILLSSLSSYSQVFLHLDALDESPEWDRIRQRLLDGIADIFDQASNLHILVTSRDVPNIRCFMQGLDAKIISIAAETVDVDIQKYISTQLLRDPKLSRLNNATKTLIKETLTRKADGMFRWVYCQLVELTKSKNTRPKSVEAALLALPKNLDETYERMLKTISEGDHLYALTLIRWLAYARSPLSLAELAEASTVDTTDDKATNVTVDKDNQGEWGDVFEILAGLVVIDGANEGDMVGSSGNSVAHPRELVGERTRVRLAHFSVKEYLESSRMLTSKVETFHLNPPREHRFLTQSCLVYLSYYSSSSQKTSTRQDFITFPLLRYAAKQWNHHALLQQPGDTQRELSLLASKVRLLDWLLVYDPHQRANSNSYFKNEKNLFDDWFDREFRLYSPESFDLETPAPTAGEWDSLFDGDEKLFEELVGPGGGLYYASLLGLETPAQNLLNAGAEVNAHGGVRGTALVAASSRGHEKIVQMLLNAGADVNAQSDLQHKSALREAIRGGHDYIARILINAGADTNARGSDGSTALREAIDVRNDNIVQALTDAGVDIHALDDGGESALHAAIPWCRDDTMRILIDAGADVNAPGGHERSALHQATRHGRDNIVRMLIDAGADIHALDGDSNNALLKAVSWNRANIVQMLINAGADIDAPGGDGRTALTEAINPHGDDIVRMLVDAGADIDARGRDGDSAILLATMKGKDNIVRLLIDAVTDIHILAYHSQAALYTAVHRGFQNIVRILINAGADIHVPEEDGRSALSYAKGEMVQVMLDAEAEYNAKPEVQKLRAVNFRAYMTHRSKRQEILSPVRRLLICLLILTHTGDRQRATQLAQTMAVCRGRKVRPTEGKEKLS